MPLSVVIPTLNAARCIAGQFAALAAQVGPDLGEVLVSDNGSVDNIVPVVANWAGRLPGLRLIDASERRGPSYARNVAVRAARFDTIAFCDADDEVGPRWVEGMAGSLASHGLVTGPIDLRSLNPPWVAESRLDGAPDPMLAPWDAHWMPFGFGANIGVTRRAFDLIGGFDESMRGSEDMDFCWRVQLAGFPLHFEPRAVVAYRLAGALPKIFRKSVAYSQSYVRLCRKFRPLGLPLAPFSARRLARRWKKVLRRTPGRMRSRAGRAALAFEVGDNLGLLIGAVRYRVSVF